MDGKSRSTHTALPTWKARHHPPGSYPRLSWNFLTGLSTPTCWRRINLTTNHVVDEETAAKNPAPVQYDLFTDYEALEKEQREEKEKLAKERKVQTAILNIKKQFGKNAILKGLNYEEGATAKERNEQIGGHKA